MTSSMEPERSRSPSRARPYTLTAGRTVPRIELPLEATVEVVADAEQRAVLDDVRTPLVQLCGTRQSIAELSSYTNMPIGVTRVLVADLVESGHLHVHATLADRATVAEQRRLIERTLDGLRAL